MVSHIGFVGETKTLYINLELCPVNSLSHMVILQLILLEV